MVQNQTFKTPTIPWLYGEMIDFSHFGNHALAYVSFVIKIKQEVVLYFQDTVRCQGDKMCTEYNKV